ncbi:putative reverse transcriptase [Hamiltosporidium magnivora]|uniref:Putative reverse transcriptase n=1 Tax=Hamiltosporidium magnivora TaxID=148818 RepID=A0A4Q9LJ41_9MICR|nr:putative reverse transcriptase [Hamiltosporidium magnivora]
MLAKTNSIALEVLFKEIEKLRKVAKRSRRCRTHKCVITVVALVSSVRLKARAKDPPADPAASELVCNAAELTEKPLEQNLVVNEAKSQSFGPTLAARSALAKARSLVKQIVLRTGIFTDLTANAVDSLAAGICPVEVQICNAAESQGLQAERAMNVSHQGARPVECGTGNTTLPPIATPRSIEKNLPEKTSVSASGKSLKDKNKELFESKATGNPASKPRAVKLQTAKKPSFDRTKAPSKQSRGKLNLNRAQCEDVVQGKSPFVLNRHRSVFAETLQAKGSKGTSVKRVIKRDGRRRLDGTVETVSRKHLGYCKTHTLGRKKSVGICTESYGNLRLLTLNVNSFGSKREEVLMLTGKLHPDILCLQETLRYTESSRHVIPGYEVIESFANKEEKDGRGLVLAVRCKLDLTLSSVEVHPNLLAGSVCGKKASGGWFKLLVVNLYIPPKCSLYGNRAETLEALGSFLVSENKKNGLDDILQKKACGLDEVPVEAYKALLMDSHGVSLMAQHILHVLNEAWTNRIPDSWRVSVIVPVPNKEECVAQVATLLEIQRRRFIRGRETLCLFIDFEKAYDRVPHDLILLKLKEQGFSGKLLRFLKDLYTDLQVGVKVGDKTTSLFPYNIGLRQGCPLSPLLFDLYIDDIFRGVNGIVCEGLNYRFPGLLFADDIELFGMSKVRIVIVVCGVTRSLAAAFGCRENFAQLVAFRECDIQPLYEKAAMSRVRGFLK